MPGKKDDGFQTIEQALSYARLTGGAANLFSLPERRWVRVTSVGRAATVRFAIWRLYEFSGRQLTVPANREEELP